MHIRTAIPDDVDRIKDLAVVSGMFSIEEAAFFDEMLGGFFDGSMEGHQWLVLQDDSQRVQAAANYAPEPFSDRMWNLYFIAVDPSQQGRGLGRALMAHAEAELRAMGPDHASVLIVETSSTDQFALTRQFYAQLGYDEEARVRQFYGPDDHKVMFWKSLSVPIAQQAPRIAE